MVKRKRTKGQTMIHKTLHRKLKKSVMIQYKVDIIIFSLKCSLFSSWYGWKIALLALNNNHLLIQSLQRCIIRIHKSMDRNCNLTKRKKLINNGPLKTTQKTKDWATVSFFLFFLDFWKTTNNYPFFLVPIHKL